MSYRPSKFICEWNVSPHCFNSVGYKFTFADSRCILGNANNCLYKIAWERGVSPDNIALSGEITEYEWNIAGKKSLSEKEQNTEIEYKAFLGTNYLYVLVKCKTDKYEANGGEGDIVGGWCNSTNIEVRSLSKYGDTRKFWVNANKNSWGVANYSWYTTQEADGRTYVQVKMAISYVSLGYAQGVSSMDISVGGDTGSSEVFVGWYEMVVTAAGIQ